MTIRPKFTEVGSKEWLDHSVQFFRSNLKLAERDCRNLAGVWRELRANEAWRSAGYDDAEAFVREVLKARSVAWCDTIELGARLIEDEGQDAPVPASAAAARARVETAARRTTGEVLPSHRPSKDERRQIADLPTPQTDRAAAAGVSERTQRKLDALARRAPALLDRVRSGDMSAHAAAVEAGIVKVRTPQQIILREWAKLTTAEQRAMLVELCEIKDARELAEAGY